MSNKIISGDWQKEKKSNQVIKEFRPVIGPDPVSIDVITSSTGIRFVVTDSRGTKSYDYAINQGQDGKDGVSPEIECKDTEEGLALFIRQGNSVDSKFISNGRDGANGVGQSATIKCDDVTVAGEPYFRMIINSPGSDPVEKMIKIPKDGIDGTSAAPAIDGFSPIIDCTQTESGEVIVQITDARGAGTPKVIPSGRDGNSASIDMEQSDTGAVTITTKYGDQCDIKTIPPGRDGSNGTIVECRQKKEGEYSLLFDGEEQCVIRDGADGCDGSPGADGQSATIDCVPDSPNKVNFTINNPGLPPKNVSIEGPQGPRGMEGATGATNYELAQKFAGFPGTLNQYLESLYGRDGADGRDGTSAEIECEETINGFDIKITTEDKCNIKSLSHGRDGTSPTVTATQDADGDVALSLTDARGTQAPIILPAGRNGSDGATGPRGEQGRDGVDGRDGADGQDGRLGLAGADGAGGQRGDRGEPGEAAKVGCVQVSPSELVITLESPGEAAVVKTLVAPAGERGQDGTAGRPGSQVTCDQSIAGQTTIFIDGRAECVIRDGTNGGSGSTVQCRDEGNFVSILIDGAVACTIPKGTNGQDGQNGADGFSPVIDTRSTSDGSVVFSVTTAEGTETKTIPSGRDGQDGVSPTIDCVSSQGSITFTINDREGEKSKTINVGDGGDGCCNTGLSIGISDGNLRVSVDQSNGEKVTDVVELPSNKDTLVTDIRCSVASPDTLDARLNFQLELSSGETVTESISGEKLWQAVSAFAPSSSTAIECKKLVDPSASCKEFISITSEGSELCRVQPYETPNKFCKRYCVENVTGEFNITMETDDGSTFSVDWGNANDNAVASGEAASNIYDNPYSGPIIVCLDNPCAIALEFFSDRKADMTKDCSGEFN